MKKWIIITCLPFVLLVSSLVIFLAVIVGGQADRPIPTPCTEDTARRYFSVFQELGAPWDLVLLIDFFLIDKNDQPDIEDNNPLITALNFFTIESVYYIWVWHYETCDEGTVSRWGEWVQSNVRHLIGSGEIRDALGLDEYAGAWHVRPAIEQYDESYYIFEFRMRESFLHIVPPSEYRQVIEQFYGYIFDEDEIDDIMELFLSGYIHHLYRDSVGVFHFLGDLCMNSPPPSGEFWNPIYPINWRAIISAAFGSRGYPGHTGIDFAIPTGTNISASQSGRVHTVRFGRTGYGHFVVIDHGGGVATLYAHLSQILVREGMEVARGELIALSGDTGNSTGPHLHFEIIIGGVPKDPEDFL